MAFDTYVVPADVIVPLLVEAHEARKNLFSGSRLAHAIEVIESWDRRSAASSIAQTYMYFWARAYEDLFSHEKFSRFLRYSRRDIRIDSPQEQTMALAAMQEAMNRMQACFGKIDVPWGEVNVVVRGGTFPLDGTGLFDVLHPDAGMEQDNGQIHDNDGWGHILVVVESEPKEVWSLLPLGESENPASPHYNDLAKLHSERKLKRFWFTLEDIRSHTESVWGDKERINRVIRG
jgi:acyl-homoserine lactone acylase PvdQ